MYRSLIEKLVDGFHQRLKFARAESPEGKKTRSPHFAKIAAFELEPRVLYSAAPMPIDLVGGAEPDTLSLDMPAAAFATTLPPIPSSSELVVTTALDVDDGDTSSIAALKLDPGADGLISLREAITAINHASSPSTIEAIQFAIPEGSPGHYYYQDDGLAGSLGAVTAVPAGGDAAIVDFDPDHPHSWLRIDLDTALGRLDVSDRVFIDGYSQAGATENTQAIGNDAVIKIELTDRAVEGNRGLTFQADSQGSVVRGLTINGFGAAGILAESGASGLVVQGNFIGTDVSGTQAIANGDAGIHLRSSDNLIGGENVADRNLLSGNQNRGLTTFSFSGEVLSGNRFENNYIGTDSSGLIGLANFGATGVQLYNSDSAIVIGNVIAGNDGNGIQLFESANGGNVVNSVIQGNLIGVAADGSTALGNNGPGILVEALTTNTVVGGTVPGEANVIANNDGTGVRVLNGATEVSIRGNQIFANTNFAIDLGPGGVTFNDSGDADSGANNLQNFPVINRAEVGGTDLYVTFNLDAAPGTAAIIDFYATGTPDGSGYGEAERYIGSITTVVDGSGDPISGVLTGASVAVGEEITSTATVSGNTSEFSVNSVAAANQDPTNIDPESWTGPENLDTTGGELVGYLTADDVDSGETFTFSIVNTPGTDFDKISIVGDELYLDDGVLDFERKPVYAFDVQVADRVGNTFTERLTINIEDINDAPTLAGGGSLPDVFQGQVDPGGSSIGTLLSAQFGDQDAGSAFAGVAVVQNSTNDLTEGAWEYSTNGNAWRTIGAVNDFAFGLTLQSSSLVRFVPVAGYVGPPNPLQVRAIDDTFTGQFSNNGIRRYVDPAANGGMESISADKVNLTVDVIDHGFNVVSAGATSEDGSDQFIFSVSLKSAPTSTVVIPVGISDTSEGQLAISQLAFTSSNWNQIQTVVVSGVNDFVADGDVGYQVEFGTTVSADSIYDQRELSDLNVVNLDDDSAGVLVSEAAISVDESGTAATFDVVLQAAPTADVMIVVLTTDASEAVISTELLTFTPSDWSIAQSVTVTGVDDVEVDGSIVSQIQLGTVVSADPSYSGLAVADVTVTTTDNDVEEAIVDEAIVVLPVVEEAVKEKGENENESESDNESEIELSGSLGSAPVLSTTNSGSADGPIQTGQSVGAIESLAKEQKIETLDQSNFMPTNVEMASRSFYVSPAVAQIELIVTQAADQIEIGKQLELFSTMEALSERFEDTNSNYSVQLDLPNAATITATVSFAFYGLFRAGAMTVASLVIQGPMWRSLDPLTVLGYAGESGKDSETLLDIVDNQQDVSTDESQLNTGPKSSGRSSQVVGAFPRFRGPNR